jgi:hypothetical protein
MRPKQKLSLLAASILPALALAAYMFLAPMAANATGNICHAPCGYEGTGCENGAGGCYPNGY